MWKKLSNHDTISMLHVGSALLLAVILVISSFVSSVVTSADGSRNNPPYVPSNPFPVNGSTNISITTHLNWTGGDPDNDTVTYNVFFGTNQTPPQVATNITTTMYNQGTMNFSTTYYWKIISWDNNSQSTSGPLWVFTTRANQPPNEPSDPFPANNSVDVAVNTELSWTGGDPDNDSVSYDVYFGTNQTPGQVANNISTTLYSPGILASSTQYFWRIVARDQYNATTAGPLWDFTTIGIPENITVKITQPLNNSLYINGVRHNLSGRTIVYGAITITAEVSSPEGIQRVDFYVDGKFLGNDTLSPYEFPWNPFIQFNGLSLRHTIKVTAVDVDNESASAQINVTKWRFHVLPVLLLGAAVVSSAITHTTMKGLVFNLRENGQGYTFFAIYMKYHTVGLLRNQHGIIQMKRCTARRVIGPMTIFRLGPFHTFVYVSITFLGNLRIATNPTGGLLQNFLRPQGTAGSSSNR